MTQLGHKDTNLMMLAYAQMKSLGAYVTDLVDPTEDNSPQDMTEAKPKPGAITLAEPETKTNTVTLVDGAGSNGMTLALTIAVGHFLDPYFRLINQAMGNQPGPEVMINIDKCPLWFVNGLNHHLPGEWRAILDRVGSKKILIITCLRGPKSTVHGDRGLHDEKILYCVKSLIPKFNQRQDEHYAAQRKKIRDAFLSLGEAKSLKVTIPVQREWPTWFIQSIPHCSITFTPTKELSFDGVMTVKYVG